MIMNNDSGPETDWEHSNPASRDSSFPPAQRRQNERHSRVLLQDRFEIGLKKQYR